MTNQNYEKYWKITLGYTDIFSEAFNKTLNVIVHFINETRQTIYSKSKYKKLQKKINAIYPKNDASIRKVINTFIKLGFINTRLESYNSDTIAFLREGNVDKKKSLFSKIVYSNSSFDRSVTKNSEKKEINFLIKTLEHVGKLNKEDILALMTTDVSFVTKGYLNKDELTSAREYAQTIHFDDRKYNQKSHLWSIIKNLDDLKIVDDNLYLEEDAFDIKSRIKSEKRDPYLHRIYKNQLKEESKDSQGRPQCMAKHISSLYLVASHIKPFIDSSNIEAYNPDNGLLLSRDLDAYFNYGDISFNDSGTIILSSRLSSGVIDDLKKYRLDKKYLNERRIKYLEYHRTKIFKTT